MNDQLQEAIKQMIDKSVAAIEKGASFASEQVPDIIQQYLMWAMAESILFVILMAIIWLVSYKFIFVWSNQKKEYGMLSDSKVLACIGGAMASFIAGIVGIASIFQIVQILIAPKVFLLEKFMSLVK